MARVRVYRERWRGPARLLACSSRARVHSSCLCGLRSVAQLASDHKFKTELEGPLDYSLAIVSIGGPFTHWYGIIMGSPTDS